MGQVCCQNEFNSLDQQRKIQNQQGDMRDIFRPRSKDPQLFTQSERQSQYYDSKVYQSNQSRLSMKEQFETISQNNENIIQQKKSPEISSQVSEQTTDYESQFHLSEEKTKLKHKEIPKNLQSEILGENIDLPCSPPPNDFSYEKKQNAVPLQQQTSTQPEIEHQEVQLKNLTMQALRQSEKFTQEDIQQQINNMLANLSFNFDLDESQLLQNPQQKVIQFCTEATQTLNIKQVGDLTRRATVQVPPITIKVELIPSSSLNAQNSQLDQQNFEGQKSIIQGRSLRKKDKNARRYKTQINRKQQSYLFEENDEEDNINININQKKPPFAVDKLNEEKPQDLEEEQVTTRQRQETRQRVTQQSVETYTYYQINSQLDFKSELLNADIIDKPKTDMEKQFLLKYIRKLYQNNQHNEEDELQFIKYFAHFSVYPGDIIYQQGNQACNAFILETGKLKIFVNNKKDDKIVPGQMFGEIALMLEVERESTVQAVKPSTLWAISKYAFKQSIEKMQRNNKVENRLFIESISFLASLSDEQKEQITSSLVTVKFNKNDQITHQGEVADRMFIIKQGQVQILVDQQQKSILRKGEFFGELSLINQVPRSSDAIAYSDIVKCLVLIRDIIKKILGNGLQEMLHRNVILNGIKWNEILKNLLPEQQQAVAQSMQITLHKRGEIIMKQNTSCCEVLYLLIQGNLVKQLTSESIKPYCIGEKYIFYGQTDVCWDDNLVAETEVTIASIRKQELQEVLGGSLQEIIKQNEMISVLRNIWILKSLNNKQLSDLLKLLVTKNFRNDEVIISENEIADSFYMIQQGKVDIMNKGKYQHSLGKYDYFGEKSLLYNMPNNISVVAKVRKEDFNKILGEKLTNILKKRLEMQFQAIELSDLNCLKILGSGIFSTIVLCKHKEKDVFYVLKCISRQTIKTQKLYNKINNERQILLSIDHPLIMRCVKTFKDERRVYFLNEFVLGINLLQVMTKLGAFKSQQSQFYVANILIVLEYLHDRNIAYRDLKPINLIMDSVGYLILLDFRTAKLVDERTYTLIGTPHYTAPEVINGKGSNTAVDIWALGVMLYEFMCSKVPFGNDKEDPYEIYSEILKQQLTFPNTIPKNDTARLLIEQALDKNHQTRVSVQKLKKHDFFADLN